MNLKQELKYNKDHTWVKIEGEVATLGIIQESINNAKEIVFINLPGLGENLIIGEIYTDVESLKTSVQLSSPVSGQVIEINEELFDEPNLLNEDSYLNYVCKVKIENLDDLMDFDQAKKYYEGKTK